MHGYKALFNGQETDIHANSQYEAKQKAVEYFKPRKSQAHMVHVHLCEKNGEQVTHTPTF
ncbi:MAG: hypothetical protein V3V74_07295 [Nitrosomonadaceae bacterium]